MDEADGAFSFPANRRDVPRVARTVVLVCHLNNGEAHSLERRADQQNAAGGRERSDLGAVALIAGQQGDSGLGVCNGRQQHR